MGILTNVFYLISTSLLIPIMLALLLCLTRILVLVGQTLRESLSRARSNEALQRLSVALEQGRSVTDDLPRNGLVAKCVSQLMDAGDDELLAEKVLREAELVWQAELDRLRSMSRFGPALGLMGTLIPLGPALVGLAAGDLQMMSNNLVIAFATTVVGLLIGTVATLLLGIKKRWYQKDALLVTFAANRLPQISLLSSPVSDPLEPHRFGESEYEDGDPVSVATCGREGES